MVTYISLKLFIIPNRSIKDFTNRVDKEVIDSFKDLHEKLECYEPKNTFNCDEKRFLFKCSSTKTLDLA